MTTELASPAKPIRTLLVDDSRGFLDALTRLLERAPQVIVSATATSAMEALMEVAQSAPDLVVIDVAMPGMSGIEATRRIKHAPKPPRIIVVTISIDAAYAVAAREAGADGFLTKSACRTQLIPLIESFFGTTA